MDWGKSSHEIPVYSTNRIPLRAASSLTAPLARALLVGWNEGGNQGLLLLPPFFAHGTSGHGGTEHDCPVGSQCRALFAGLIDSVGCAGDPGSIEKT